MFIFIKAKSPSFLSYKYLQIPFCIQIWNRQTYRNRLIAIEIAKLNMLQLLSVRYLSTENSPLFQNSRINIYFLARTSIANSSGVKFRKFKYMRRFENYLHLRSGRMLSEFGTALSGGLCKGCYRALIVRLCGATENFPDTRDANFQISRSFFFKKPGALTFEFWNKHCGQQCKVWKILRFQNHLRLRSRQMLLAATFRHWPRRRKIQSTVLNYIIPRIASQNQI